MPTESATYISQLDATQPVVNAPAGEGDDHLRLLKLVLQAQFPNLGPNAVTVLAVELNRLAGLTDNIMTLFGLKANLASPTFTGTPAAPTPSLADSSTRIATTAYVNGVAMSGIPPEILDQINALTQALAALGTAAYLNEGTGAGNLMLVGAFGLGSSAPQISNLNNASVTGANRYSNSATNAPAAEAGTVFTNVIDSNNATQIAISVESDTIWIRRKAAGTWQGWIDIVGSSSASVPSLAVTLNGGTHNLDLSAARYFYGPLTSNSTINFQNIPSTGFFDVRLEVQNPSTRTITPSQSITWDGYSGFPPMGASGRTILGFEGRDYGTTAKIYGYVLRRGTGT